jgi:dienelactone hydrolase
MRQPLALCALALVLTSLGSSAATEGDDPAYVAAALADRAAAEQRGLDQLQNPAYQQLIAPRAASYFSDNDPAVLVDPFLDGWRGSIRRESLRNRYGATLRGSLFLPARPWHEPASGRVLERLPGVVFLPGFGGPAASGDGLESYRGLLEQLADAGYAVLAISPQGEGSSDVRPAAQFCGGGSEAAWRRPQELGLTERGECAGFDAPEDGRSTSERSAQEALAPTGLGPTVTTVAPLFTADVVRQARLGQYEELKQPIRAAYRGFRARWVFAAFDTAAWLARPGNEVARVMDTRRLALVGHSAGADGALVAANGDPHHRFVAAVALDDFGVPPSTMRPTVPTMVFQSEQQQVVGPWVPKPPTRMWDSYAVADAFSKAHVPHALLALRGSTHQEWSHVPEQAANPIAPLTGASRYGGQVSTNLSVAWLDRWLREGPARTSADRRLRSRVLDNSTDRTNRGQGTWDPIAGANVPYAIAGRTLTESLSRIFDSELALDGRLCRTWQAGC